MTYDDLKRVFHLYRIDIFTRRELEAAIYLWQCGIAPAE